MSNPKPRSSESSETPNSSAVEPSEQELRALDAVEVARAGLAQALDDLRVARGESATQACEYCEGSGKDALAGLMGCAEDAPCERCKGTGQVARRFPWVVTSVEYQGQALQPSLRRDVTWVSVRPCAEEYGKKTYLGWLLGDIALMQGVRFDRAGKLTVTMLGHNPAIFVPDLGKVIFGCESWWAAIKGPEDLRKISDADIDNVWYVQALKSLARPA